MRDALALWGVQFDLYRNNEKMITRLGGNYLFPTSGDRNSINFSWALHVLFEHIKPYHINTHEAVTVTTSACLDEKGFVAKVGL